MPAISVIIPMYNEERYIARCLNSLVAQTMKDFELILIDDGSTDQSIRIASAYSDALDLTILEQQHGGPGKARNRGAQQAKGEILVFVDADMVFDTRYIEELVKPIQHGTEKGTAHGWEYIANKDHRLARAYGMIRVAYDPHHPRGGVFRAIKKDIFLSNAGYDNSRYAFEDDMAEKIGQALYVPAAICYHNNPETLSEIFSHEVWIGESLIAKGMLKEYLHKYRSYLIGVVIMAIIALAILIRNDVSVGHIIAMLGLLLIAVAVLIGIKRAWKEHYLSHILFVPIVMITRGIGYIRGMLRYMITA